jgi:hypothetical protein
MDPSVIALIALSICLNQITKYWSRRHVWRLSDLNRNGHDIEISRESISRAITKETEGLSQ